MKSGLILLAAPAMTCTDEIRAQSDDLSGKVTFVSVTTARVMKAGQPLDEFAPNVLLRFRRSGTSSQFLAMTGKDGTAFLPIEAGHYCVDAFGLDGHKAKLAPRAHQCFTAIPGEAVEFSLTLGADVAYRGTIPSLGVE